MRVETEILRSRSEQIQKDIRKLDGMINESDLIRQKLEEQESLKDVSMILKIWSQGAKEIRESFKRYQRLTAAAADRYERCEKKVFQQVNEYTVRRYPPTVISVTILPVSDCEQVIMPFQFQLYKSENVE